MLAVKLTVHLLSESLLMRSNFQKFCRRCPLTPLMSLQDTNCKLIDQLIEMAWLQE